VPAFTVRRASREELPAVEAVRIAAWQVAYRGVVPEEVLDALAVTEERVAHLQARYDEGAATTWVALDGDEVIGMAVVGPSRDEDREGDPELYALYVLPSHWGSGAGQALWDAGQPFTSLWVLQDNPRARAFYERNGFRATGTKDIEIGVVLPEVRYVAGAHG
jgi:ribosomal protein S18 acetylase RimI-like enzyme